MCPPHLLFDVRDGRLPRRGVGRRRRRRRIGVQRVQSGRVGVEGGDAIGAVLEQRDSLTLSGGHTRAQ
eukprot:5333108-Pleurochrysis_carterae.AAC.1